MSLTYKDAGVDYDPVDAFKVYAQWCALYTQGNALRLGVSPIRSSRGESAFLSRLAAGAVGHVDEGLGTKNLVADSLVHEIEHLSGIADHLMCPVSLSCFRNPSILYRSVAQCAVAMVVNDMITTGCFPCVQSMHLSVGSSRWFHNRNRWEEIAYGWMLACQRAGCVWGGGETAVLADIIHPDRFVLSGSAWGVPLFPDAISGEPEEGDSIVFLGSSGIHANGLTLARRIAERLPDGYLTRMNDGRAYGEALLMPTTIYVPFIEQCIREKIRIRYLINMTGHGWRKLMRLDVPWSYEVTAPGVPTLFSFIQEKGKVDEKEMYGTFNMGVGFALIVDPDDAKKVCSFASCHQQPAWIGGHVEKSKKKTVVIRRPYTTTIEFQADEMDIR